MSICQVALRDYQQEMKARVFEAWRSHGSVMVQMPTGTGKTHVLAAVIRAFLSSRVVEPGERPGEIWIIAHRRELVAQIEETLERYDIGRAGGAVRALSIQWLTWHQEELSSRPSLLVIDEAHHALAATYAALWRRYPSALKLGMTATPCRMNRRGFTSLFDVLLTSWSISEFILQGYLSPFDYVTLRPGSSEQRLIDGLEKRSADGDYQVKEMDTVLNCGRSIGRLYDSVARYAAGKKGIVYAIGISHARRIASYYSARGLAAVALDSRTPARERARIVESFRRGEIRVLVNVDVFSEGFDCPDAEFIQLARPTLSLAKYLQQVGRGLRRSAGKSSCVLLDNVGLYRVFGLPTASWDWAALFRGAASGKGTATSSGRRGGTAAAEVPDDTGEGCRMEVVMTHDRLLPALREEVAHPETRERKPSELQAWRDGARGLWGLRLGDEKITEAIYAEEPVIRYGMAAVRFPDRRYGLVDLSGRLVREVRHCRAVRFTRNGFLETVSTDGRERYTDLYSLRSYDDRPEVKRYGGVELLKLGRVYYSRTRRVYENGWNIGRHRIIRHRFYVTVFDPHAPAWDPVSGEAIPGSRGGYACLLDGDYESYYWMYRRLEDGSIIVRDDEGRYYHAEEGREKRLLGSVAPAGAAGGCREEIARLSARIGESGRLREAAREERRRRLLAAFTEATPFRSGMKWGLKLADRILVPPIYRNVRPPVGRYCAVEKSYSRWGIIALDGRVVVEPNYPEVAISDDGTAVLTSVTGKTFSVVL